MGKNNKFFRRLIAICLLIGISFTDMINIHAENSDATGTSQPLPTQTAVTEQRETEETASPSEKPQETASPSPSATPDTPAEPAVEPSENTPKPEENTNKATEYNMYRLYNPNSGEHFYTSSESEREHLKAVGWIYEGVGWVAPADGDAVYRMYNKNGGEHHYTLSKAERDSLVRNGWNYEGIGWYSDTQKRVTVYREYNPNKFSCNHNYTTSATEHNKLVRIGWRNEGIAFYAVRAGWERHYVHGKVPYFMQTDQRWANQKIGGLTFGSTGCGVTTMAMIITAFTGKTVLPPAVGEYLYEQKQYNYTDAGTTGTSRLIAAKHWGLQVDKILSSEQMKTALSEGMIISEMTENTFANGCHGVVVFGNDNGYATVYDPYFKKNTGRYSIDYMWKARSLNPLSYDAGAVIFGFYK